MADKRDYYEVLGIDKGADDDAVKKAFRQKAKLYHPDLHPGDKDCESHFKEVNEAYEVLSDKEKRARYDQYGHAGVDPNFGAGAGGGSPFGGGFDVDDIFSSFFGGFGGFGGNRRSANPNAPRRGTDVEANVTISFEEAAKGTNKKVSYKSINTCSECNGTGAEKGTDAKVCNTCHGTGKVTVNQRTAFGVVQTQSQCTECHGRGKVIDHPCKRCNGTGRTRQTKEIEITIPAGISDEQILNVAGRGNDGINGGPAGDLHVYVNVRPHPIFERKGDDVWCDMPISFVTATLGGDVIVPTLDGKVSYTVHEGTQPGDIFKLKGKGITHIRGRGKGDQYVRMTVEIPKSLNSKQKNMIKEFDKLTTEKNYAKKKTFREKMKGLWND